MNLSLAIQTHPLRHGMASALAAALGAELVPDPQPDGIRSPWRTYRHVLETTPPGATHRVVFQDDIVPCRWFTDVLGPAIASRPGRLLSFFVGGHPVEHARRVYQACECGDSWCELDNLRWCPVIALSWPVEMIGPFLAYVDEQRWPESFRSDDEIVGRWMRATKQTPLATVPSLVEHPDKVPSLLGRRARAGEDVGRVAACFIHEDCDCRTIDWDLGAGAQLTPA